MGPRPGYQQTGVELEAAAAAGDGAALLRLAAAAEHGWRGVEQDEARAIELEQQAAAVGHARAMRLLGDRYSRGRGVPANPGLALTWWRNAARAGDVDAMANLLDLMYSADPDEASEGRHWAELAAAEGHPYAVTVLSVGAPARLSANTELAWRAEHVPASLAQINDLVGRFLERVRELWPNPTHSTTCAGEPVDFPCPDAADLPGGITSASDALELTFRAGAIHLQLDAALWDEGWILALTSFEPHPSADIQAWLLGHLRVIARGLHVPLA